MPYSPPNKILITSDNNELEFIATRLVNKEAVFVYRFIKSETKLNLEMSFSEVELKRQLINFFKII